MAKRVGQHMSAEERDRAQALFLLHFREQGNVKLACELASVGRASVYRWLDKPGVFADKYREAEADAADVIAGEIFRRGVKGVEEPLTSGGRVLWAERPALDDKGAYMRDAKGRLVTVPTGDLMTVTKYSDACLLALASARVPGFKGAKVGAESESSANGLDLDAIAEQLDRKLARLVALTGEAPSGRVSHQEPDDD